MTARTESKRRQAQGGEHVGRRRVDCRIGSCALGRQEVIEALERGIRDRLGEHRAPVGGDAVNERGHRTFHRSANLRADELRELDQGPVVEVVAVRQLDCLE